MAVFTADHDSLALVRAPPHHNETHEAYAAGRASKLYCTSYPGELGDRVP